MLKLFAKYTSIGVINTLIHWVVFAICIYVFHTGQALGNFAGFVLAVSFSFFANARFTFKSSTTTMRYMLYVGFMGTLSAAVGWGADRSGMAPIITLISSPPSVWCAVLSIQSSLSLGMRNENFSGRSRLQRRRRDTYFIKRFGNLKGFSSMKSR
jgi:putative flippase GtrA